MGIPVLADQQNLHSSALCGDRVSFKGITKCDGRESKESFFLSTRFDGDYVMVVMMIKVWLTSHWILHFPSAERCDM